MSITSRQRPFLLIVGDTAVFILSLWIALLIRYLALPSAGIFLLNLVPFLAVFVVWILIFFIFGLYEKHSSAFSKNLTLNLIKAQLFNALAAVVFFYFFPGIGISPKTVLFVYLLVSFVVILSWRLSVYHIRSFSRVENAILVGDGEVAQQLRQEIARSTQYGIRLSQIEGEDSLESGDFLRDLAGTIRRGRESLVILDFYDPRLTPVLKDLYDLIFSQVRFVDIRTVYEDIFGRVALSLLDHSWFLERVWLRPAYVYDALKRTLDIVVSFILGIISLVLYPFVFIAIKLDDGGPMFVVQERVGQNGQVISIVKFRSMKTSDRGIWVKENDSRITRVGSMIRKTRVDELPQLWNVLRGDLSLVGPRPDICELGMKLTKEIPFYALRSTIKPGLSGWAQIKQDFPPQSLEETKLRLAYDFYYIIHRSFFLDLKIALQTIATLLSRAGK